MLKVYTDKLPSAVSVHLKPRLFFIYTARVICFHNVITSLTSVFTIVIRVLHLSFCRLRAISYFFFQLSGCNASRAVCCERRDTRVSAGETLVVCRVG